MRIPWMIAHLYKRKSYRKCTGEGTLILISNYNFKYQDKTDVNFLDMIKYYKFNSISTCFFAVKQN